MYILIAVSTFQIKTCSDLMVAQDQSRASTKVIMTNPPESP